MKEESSLGLPAILCSSLTSTLLDVLSRVPPFCILVILIDINFIQGIMCPRHTTNNDYYSIVKKKVPSRYWRIYEKLRALLQTVNGIGKNSLVWGWMT